MVVFLGQLKTFVTHHSYDIKDIQTTFLACDRKGNLALLVIFATWWRHFSGQRLWPNV